MIKLDPRTVLLVEQAFSGHTCKVCGYKAQKMTNNRQFFCVDHFPVSKEKQKERLTAYVQTGKLLDSGYRLDSEKMEH